MCILIWENVCAYIVIFVYPKIYYRDNSKCNASSKLHCYVTLLQIVFSGRISVKDFYYLYGHIIFHLLILVHVYAIQNTNLILNVNTSFFFPEFLLMNIRGWANNLIFIYGSRWNAGNVCMLFKTKPPDIYESFILYARAKPLGKLNRLKFDRKIIAGLKWWILRWGRDLDLFIFSCRDRKLCNLYLVFSFATGI